MSMSIIYRNLCYFQLSFLFYSMASTTPSQLCVGRASFFPTAFILMRWTSLQGYSSISLPASQLTLPSCVTNSACLTIWPTLEPVPPWLSEPSLSQGNFSRQPWLSRFPPPALLPPSRTLRHCFLVACSALHLLWAPKLFLNLSVLPQGSAGSQSQLYSLGSRSGGRPSFEKQL